MNTITLPPDEIYTEQLFDVVSGALEPLSMFFDMIENDNDQVATVGQALYDNAMHRIEEAFEMVRGNVGQINFSAAMSENTRNFPTGKLLSCRLDN